MLAKSWVSPDLKNNQRETRPNPAHNPTPCLNRRLLPRVEWRVVRFFKVVTFPQLHILQRLVEYSHLFFLVAWRLQTGHVRLGGCRWLCCPLSRTPATWQEDKTLKLDPNGNETAQSTKISTALIQFRRCPFFRFRSTLRSCKKIFIFQAPMNIKNDRIKRIGAEWVLAPHFLKSIVSTMMKHDWLQCRTLLFERVMCIHWQSAWRGGVDDPGGSLSYGGCPILQQIYAYAFYYASSSTVYMSNYCVTIQRYA